jgi:nickel-dependent lactate racemase
MKIDVPYLDKTFPLQIPDENLLAVAEPNDIALPSPDITATLEAGGISSFLGGKSVLIIINDATRPTPTPRILDHLLPFLKGKEITLLVATGGHRAPNEAEYKQILGNHYAALRERTVAHNSKDDASMVELGMTRSGTPIILNKLLFQFDRIIATGSVEPHYFAGFTGGRKAFLPGVAAYRTIQENHKRALSRKARSLALDGNPVHEDMMDALPLIKAPIFSIMTVLDKDQNLAAVEAGDLQESFYRAVKAAMSIFCVDVPSKADIVVSVARFPMDIDLYQSQKAIDNGSTALKDGGTLILVSSCRDGIGDEAYANLLSRSPTPEAALEAIDKEYKLGYHKAAKMAEVSARATVMAVSELGEERLSGMFIQKVETPQKALDMALARAREAGITTPRVLVLPDGCLTVPNA